LLKGHGSSYNGKHYRGSMNGEDWFLSGREKIQKEKRKHGKLRVVKRTPRQVRSFGVKINKKRWFCQ